MGRTGHITRQSMNRRAFLYNYLWHTPEARRRFTNIWKDRLKLTTPGSRGE